ncbi:hypothetical protein Acsp03_65430 [Actinomadura sp. NBRC 104412]|nr:hypothetical protein Acsp03_65430 [Actinomadura sp. NBRC 104412]
MAPCGGSDEAGSRAVTNRRSAAHLPVAGPRPRQGRGRWCHAGPQPATELDVTPAPALNNAHRIGARKKEGALGLH